MDNPGGSNSAMDEANEYWNNSSLEVNDLRQIMEDLAKVERACSNMFQKLPGAVLPQVDPVFELPDAAAIEDRPDKGVKSVAAALEDSWNRSVPIRLEKILPALAFVELSSDEEGEAGEVVQGAKVSVCTTRAPCFEQMAAPQSKVPFKPMVDGENPGGQGEVVQGTKVFDCASPAPSSQHVAVSTSEINVLKRKADAENTGAQDDVPYQEHEFLIPEDLRTNYDEVEEEIWNERDEVLHGLQRLEIMSGSGAIPRRKKMKALKKESVNRKKGQVIVIESDNDKEKEFDASTPCIEVTVDVLDSKGGKAKYRIQKSKSLIIKRRRTKSQKILSEEKLAKQRERERKKVVARALKEERRTKKRKLRTKTQRPTKKGKEDKSLDADEREDIERSDEPSEKEPDTQDDNRHITSQLHGEKIAYEPYVWRDKFDEEAEEDPELEEIWQDMDTVLAVSSTPVSVVTASELKLRRTLCQGTVPLVVGQVKQESTLPPAISIPEPSLKETSPSSRSCENGHAQVDFDDDMGHYCANCGAMGLDPPTSVEDQMDEFQLKPACQHKSRGYKDEVGQYCLDCGLVGYDIQKMFIPQVPLPSAKVNRPKNVNASDAGGRNESWHADFEARDVDAVDANDSEAEIHLHPYFEEKLHSHQKEGFQFLTSNLLGNKSGGSVGCILAHAPGTGKTCLMVSFIQSFLARFPEGRPIILAPKIMLKAWEDEFQKFKVEEIPIYGLNDFAKSNGLNYEEEDGDNDNFIPANEPLTLKENRAKVLRDWQGSRSVLVMSYHLFAILVEKGLNEKTMPESLDYQICRVLLDSPDLVVLDEGHLARTKKTKILKSLMQMRTKRRVLLSGTLFQNNFKELYTLLKLCREDFMSSHPIYGSQLALLTGGSTGNSRQRTIPHEQQEENLFTQNIGCIIESCVKNVDSIDLDTDNLNRAVQDLRSLTAPFVHWYPGKILETLPGLTEYSVHLKLTDVQSKVISDLPTSHKYHMTRQCKVLAACIHPSLVKEVENTPNQECLSQGVVTEKEFFQGVKIEFIVRFTDLCVKAHEKVLIFSSNLVPLSYVERSFEVMFKWKRGKNFCRLDGTMPEHDRQIVIKQFNDSNLQRGSMEPTVLMASIKACKEGITLTGASRVILIDNPDNPSVVRQAVSRAFRIGQKRKVYVYRLVTDNEEEVGLYNRSVSKEKLSKVLDRVGKTAAKFGPFLKQLELQDVKDELLAKMMKDDKGRMIDTVYNYNAAG